MDGAGTFDGIVIQIEKYTFPLAESPPRGYDETKTLAVQPPGQPDACTRFKSLVVRLGLAGGTWGFDGTGTEDHVLLDLGNKQRIVIAKAPVRYYDGAVTIDLVDVFGSKTVDGQS
ncbi:hypothetical protein CDD81_193 [Ophiocordyceps australis]|uniref:Uncharacterized protein n=1 Tax=Ophiocordyceps australis TaxID=1399860 RepID=A0A2C5YF74_9HYPO|nr:hypothetical protein CDD81_193 [Ophiocordyceps australis]